MKAQALTAVLDARHDRTSPLTREVDTNLAMFTLHRRAKPADSTIQQQRRI
jgi:hypothetical protein